jgi:sodium-dependent dicarboxylate transporter 2/3/5
VSAFITVVAVTAMMLPIPVSLTRSVGAQPGKSNFGIDMMFAITFGSILGGLSTPSGVPSNIITITFMEKSARLTVPFLQWTVIATPIAVALGLVCQWLTVRLYPPEIQQLPFGKNVIVKDL